MKFSHSLQFNAVTEWSSKYIAYSNLKKLIYQLQRDTISKNSSFYDTENQPLTLNSGDEDTDAIKIFLKQLDNELVKIDEFYQVKEKEIFADFDKLIDEIDEFDKNYTDHHNIDNSSLSSSDDASSRNSIRRLLTSIHSIKSNEHDQNPPSSFNNTNNNNNNNNSITNDGLIPIESQPQAEFDTSAQHESDDDDVNPSQQKYPRSEILFDETDFNLDFLSKIKIATLKRLVELFVKLSELNSFIELNKIGFTKILKKFDKSLNCSIKKDYLKKLPEASYIFQSTTLASLNGKINSIIKIYAIISNKSIESAKNDLRSHLREHIVWERNTVWRDMIGMERKTQLLNMESKQTDILTTRQSNEETIKKFLMTKKFAQFLIICLISTILLVVSPFSDVQQKNCFAILAFSSMLWATETIPLFITSLIIPLLIVLLNVIKDDEGNVLNSVDTSKYILSVMWNSVIMLLLGGFTLAAALSKFNIAKIISTWILSKAGLNPNIILLTIMFVALFTSMWVSNVAAPVLCFSIIQPLLRTLPQNSNFCKSLILGIALLSNIGGMASPIASPQNIIAIESMDPIPSWIQWFVISLPVCGLSLVLIWLFLIITLKTETKINIVAIRKIDEDFTLIQWYISLVTMLTIILWCFASKLSGIFGEMGIIAILPIFLFYAPGLLNTEDINNYPWNIVLLAMGGLSLGKLVSSSGLLATIALSIQSKIIHLSIYEVTLCFGLLILIVATFISHTVAALIIIPLIKEVGESLPNPHPRLMVMTSALLCSAAMGLPTSGFPNVTAICMVNDVGAPYLTVGTFITRGVPSSFIAYFVIVTVGYFTMRLINF